MKKKFILFMGLSWCGTTSLYWTLENNNIMHGGFWKETHYLYKIDVNSRNHNLDFGESDFNERILKNLEERLHTKILTYYKDLQTKNEGNSNQDESRFPTKQKAIDILKKFTYVDIDYYFKKDFSIEKYVDQYLKLAEHCDNQFQAVGDFSNRNCLISYPTIIEVKKKLEQHFDVKVLYILRDPIRRNFSTYCALTNGVFFEPIFGKYNLDIFKSKPPANTNFIKHIKKSYDIFGKHNVHYVIMEDFFKNQKNNLEVLKLEKFLDAKITQTFPCCFVPDRGINAPKIIGLRDQWSSDHEKLSPELYTDLRMRDDYFEIYEEFKKFHGSLPADWGYPIDYGY